MRAQRTKGMSGEAAVKKALRHAGHPRAREEAKSRPPLKRSAREGTGSEKFWWKTRARGSR
jgi:hypothetical protein